MITKSEKKEHVVEELKDFFPDQNITGLVVRRRKNSNANIDVDGDDGWHDSSSAAARGNDFDLGNEMEARKDNIESVLRSSYRSRSNVSGRFYKLMKKSNLNR